MAVIDTRPPVVDIIHYAGDTLTIRVVAPANLTDNMTWKAEVRSSRDAPDPDAVFTVLPPAASGDDAFIELSAADTRMLVDGVVGTLEVRTMTAPTQMATVKQYTGVWDVQVSDNGLDPVRTLSHGSLVIEQDVSK